VNAPPGWRAPGDGGSADLGRELAARGKLLLERHGQEYVLVAEPAGDRNGRVHEVRIALRRGGGPFLGPRGSFPAVGTIIDSMSLALTTPAPTLQRLGGGDRARLAQTAHALLERVARRIDCA